MFIVDMPSVPLHMFEDQANHIPRLVHNCTTPVGQIHVLARALDPREYVDFTLAVSAHFQRDSTASLN